MRLEFEVVGIKRDTDKWRVEMEGKFHSIYSSTVYLNMESKEQAADYPIGTKMVLEFVEPKTIRIESNRFGDLPRA